MSDTPHAAPVAAPRVAVLGANGKMGRRAVEAVRAAEGLELAAELGSRDPLTAVVDAGATHVLDLTVPDASPDNVAFAVENGLHAVVGTSGWGPERRVALEARLAEHPGVGVLIAPNFSVGSVLASAFAAKAARWFESVELIELHHPAKLDAPSGTAVRTAELIGDARAAAGVGPSPDATERDPDGARGAVVNGVHVHAVRLRGLEAHQEVLLGGPGEQLVVRHDAFDRGAYMPGVVLGLRTVASRPGLTYGLDGYLDLG
ncbi:4-hydroxy-tetrahydrodipicolinate reductase [Micrococcus sp. M4NT]|uniref:4-hydroxy-tetrahydrodipicolinate reductase n=1 Tax=Micrococcus sp. M4NT TaxID=2957501 RepID=UPI0029A582FA|nr:4-hydroxy-tetrahydrodipicolinate reductase [Micrococcus sp. M4NT]MDX2340830.1 4-hydroxy-tetrahydrodipicolinate reductase [Micrococcus sp. M4NT]